MSLADVANGKEQDAIEGLRNAGMSLNEAVQEVLSPAQIFMLVQDIYWQGSASREEFCSRCDTYLEYFPFSDKDEVEYKERSLDRIRQEARRGNADARSWLRTRGVEFRDE